MLKTRKETVVDVNEWDNLVTKTYGKPYSLQQQDGCKSRGTEYLTVPETGPCDFENDSIPDKINGNERGVSFKAWLARDPKQPLADGCEDSFGVGLFWKRNFYPTKEMIANDLYSKGLIEAGEYMIIIDW